MYLCIFRCYLSLPGGAAYLRIKLKSLGIAYISHVSISHCFPHFWKENWRQRTWERYIVSCVQSVYGVYVHVHVYTDRDLFNRNSGIDICSRSWGGGMKWLQNRLENQWTLGKVFEFHFTRASRTCIWCHANILCQPEAICFTLMFEKVSAFDPLMCSSPLRHLASHTQERANQSEGQWERI